MTRRAIRAITLGLALTLALAFAPGATARPLDDRLVQVSRAAPGFGGMFIEDGVLNVYMTNRRASAEAAASRALRSRFALPGRVRVLKARYGFAQLDAWNDRLTARLLGLPGVAMTDVDDRENRLTVGVTSERGRSAVTARLAALGVPRAAVHVAAAEPVSRFSSVQDFHRPLIGGLQVGSFAPCTMGFNAIRNGISGFIVNSHCTQIQGGIEGSVFYQPDSFSAGNRIGVETADPVYFRGGTCSIFFGPRRCRYSDTAFVKRDSGVPASLGYIAKADLNPLTTWNGDLYRITAKGDAIVGTLVEKVGRTTGRSAAVPVDLTCGNFAVNNTNITLLCQSRAQLFAQGGDSGSPIYTPNGSDVTVRGELWGGNPSTGQTIFSPISSIQRSTEMGPISICAPGFSC